MEFGALSVHGNGSLHQVIDAYLLITLCIYVYTNYMLYTV